MTKQFLFSCCLLIATASALAQQFPMDQFIGVNLRREDPIERLKCVGFVREYHDWAVDEDNAYNHSDDLGRFAQPRNKYAWNFRQSTSVKFDDFYRQMLSNLNYTAGNRPPVCATMQQCLPYLAGGDNYGTFSEIKPVLSSNSGTAKRAFGNETPLGITWHNAWDNPASYRWIADWLYQFTRRYGANANPPVNVPKLNSLGNQLETDKKGLNQVGYIELWNEPNKYWIKNYGDATDVSWLRATQFTGAEYAAMASAAYDAHNNNAAASVQNELGTVYAPGVQSADPNMKLVMGGSAGIREYDWKFLLDMKTWFDNNRAGFPKKYPLDVINFHHYNSNQWYGLKGTVSLPDYAASPEEDRWQLGSRNVDYDAATTANGEEPETNAPNYEGLAPQTTTQRTFKQRLVELRYRVDSLFGANNVELWMSEFGFDTNENSPYKAPTISEHGIVVADQQEVQARFIVRGYLEIAAAKWDRAMQFNFRDKQSSEGIIFDAAGLLQDKEHHFAPKKAYYYVSTLKEALKGTKFREEIKVSDDPTFTTTGLFKGHSYWYKDATYPRISRFAKDNASVANAGEVVYAAWLPTKTNAKKEGFKIYLQPSDFVATQATSVQMSVGDRNGIREALVLSTDAFGKYVTVNLTEAPIFIRLGESITDAAVATPTIDAVNTRGISCDAIRVKVTTPLPTNGSFRAYYYERNKSEWSAVPTTLDLANSFTKWYADDIQCNEFVITGLKLPHNDYQIYVQMIDVNGNVSTPATATVATTSCFNNYVPIQQISSNRESVKTQLFDYGVLDFCYPLRKIEGNYNDLGQWTANAPDSMEITLSTTYQLDGISLLEGAGSGLLEIKVLNPTTNAVQMVIPYLKSGYDEWNHLPMCNVPVQKLRLVREANANIRKIILKGKPIAASYAMACCGTNDSLLGLPFQRITNGNARLSSAFPNTNSYTGVVRVENCTLVADKPFTFGQGTKIYMQGPDAAILVKQSNLQGLTLQTTNLQGCNDLWQGITLDTGAVLRMSDSYLRDAAVGVKLLRGPMTSYPKTGFKIWNTVFEENHIGFSTWRAERQNDPNHRNDIDGSSNIWSCVFDGNFRDLKVPASDLDRRRSLIGLELSHLTASLGGGSSGRPNVFHDLGQGIKANYYTLNLMNTVFSHIQPRMIRSFASYATIAPYGGEAVSASNGNFSFVGKGKTIPIFEHVKKGFLCDYTDFNISDGLFITEGGHALQSYYGNGGSSIFYKNKVITLGSGALAVWKGGGTASIFNNNIDCGAATQSAAAVAVGSYFHREVLYSQNNASITLEMDTIRGLNAPNSSILALDMAKDVLVWRDTLIFNTYDTSRIHTAFGIKMSMLENATIVRNQITGIGNSYHYAGSPAQVGLLSANSRNNSIVCNKIANARIGMQFQYNNTDITNAHFGAIGGDTLSGYNIGLKVDSFALIGEQAHRKNVWISPEINKYQLDAVLENPNAYLRRKDDNLFKVATRPRYVSPTEWFMPENPSNVFECGLIQAPPSGTGSNGLYEAIASGAYQVSTQDPIAYVWMLEKQAYETFSELPAAVQTAAMQSFLNRKQGTEMETFYQLKKGLETLFQQDATHATRLKQLVQWMTDWATKKQLANNEWITDDGTIQEWSKEYADLTAMEQTNTLTKALALQQLNATLPDDGFTIRSKNGNTSAKRPYIFYEKVVNDLYLSKIIHKTTHYTEKEAELLKQIAMMCPLIAAEAPLKARIIYQHFVNPVALPNADCSNVPTVAQPIVEKPHFSVYPNPTNHQFTLRSDNGIKVFNWALFTSTGVFMKEGKMTTFSESIDTQDLTNGVYFICIKEKGIVTTTLKVVVAK